MNKLIIEGVPPYDGTHEFEDFATFKNRELRRIKLMSGIRAGEMPEALQAGDNDLLVALASIILERKGIEVNDELLWDADAGAIRIELEKAEDPTQASPTLPESDSSSETDDTPSSSGNGSSESSDNPPENNLSPTGDPISVTPISVLDFDRSPSVS